MEALSDELNRLNKERREREENRAMIHGLQHYADYEEINWLPLSNRIDQMGKEIRKLEDSSDILKTLNRRLDALKLEREDLRAKLKKASDDLATLAEKLRNYREQQKAVTEIADASGKNTEEWALLIEPLRSELLGEHKLTVESCDARQHDLRGLLQTRIDGDVKKQNRLGQQIVRDMNDFPAGLYGGDKGDGCGDFSGRRVQADAWDG